MRWREWSDTYQSLTETCWVRNGAKRRKDSSPSMDPQMNQKSPQKRTWKSTAEPTMWNRCLRTNKWLMSITEGFCALQHPLSNTDYWLLNNFVTGIPASNRASFLQQVPEAQQKQSNPPSIPFPNQFLPLPALQQRLSLFRSVESRRRSATKPNPIQPRGDHSWQYASTFATPDRRTRAGYLGESQQTLTGTSYSFCDPLRPSTHPHSRPYDQFSPMFRMWEELKHLLHPSHCPETLVLLAEGLIVFDHSTARYKLPNGEDLPIIRGFHGGIAANLCSIERAKYDHVLAEQTHFTGLAFEDRRAQRPSITTNSSVSCSNYQPKPLQQPPPQDQLHHLPFIDLEDSLHWMKITIF